MPSRTGARRRLGSIRLSLILLAVIPSVTLAAMWGVTTIQMFSEGLQLREQTGLSKSTGAMGTDATLALQRERSLSAEWLAGADGARDALDAQRVRTDAAIAKLVNRSDAIADAPARIGDRLYSVIAAADSLEYYRQQVDDPSDINAQQALDHYTSIIDEQVHAFQELSQVDDGDLTSQAQPLIAAEQAAELVSQEDALLTLAWPSGRLDEEARTRFENLVGARRWLVTNQLVPALHGTVKTRTERILQSEEWKIIEALEEQVLAGRTTGIGVDRQTVLPDTRERWRTTMDTLVAQYRDLIRAETGGLLERSGDEARGLLLKAASLSAAGLVAMVLCAVMSWRITRSLSQRLRGLRMATLRLAQEQLPDVVTRLNRGETVDVESATPPLDYGRDELGQVAQAFNTAQRTAVHTAVELADTRRGFQKVILGIARQSQNLVNLQLRKLDALEREHHDPHILRGLYELDSTASQLRRYEENLVIISGERPGRTWTRPVALIDILRSAVGEVAQYQRVEVDSEEDVYVVPPAVADVIHLLAELIDNATSYSPAPSPVTVRAATVAKGLAVEVEDRGLGLPDEEYAAFNAQLAQAPQFDVVALADDLRLGMFVIARLATRHGITVTLRPSPYGGTTAIVLIPHEIVVREGDGDLVGTGTDTDTDGVGVGADTRTDTDTRTGTDTGAGTAEGPREHTRTATPGLTPAPDPDRQPTAHARTGDTATVTARLARRPGPARRPDRAGSGGPAPLPRRIPQTSLAAELREDVPPSGDDARADHVGDSADDFTAERAASSLAGFQRGTLRARDDSAADEAPSAPTSDSTAPTPSADR